MAPALEVARLTRTEREKRLDELVADAWRIYHEAVRLHVAEYRDGKGKPRELAAVFALFSGGNDSTILTHLFRHTVTHVVHANTGIGVEATRQYVRDTCADWKLPLLERHPPGGCTYRELVLDRGFPGPGQHWKMYQRLKLRALEQAQREVVTHPWRQRVVFLAGRRRAESARRNARSIPEYERRRSNIWVSPLVHWTSLDMNTYRLRFPDCPRNPVSDALHMSGECLCGSFAKRDELDEVGFWYPEVRAQVEALEREADAAGVPPPRNRWGWGAYARERPSRSGPMCSSCDAGAGVAAIR